MTRGHMPRKRPWGVLLAMLTATTAGGASRRRRGAMCCMSGVMDIFRASPPVVH